MGWGRDWSRFGWVGFGLSWVGVRSCWVCNGFARVWFNFELGLIRAGLGSVRNELMSGVWVELWWF